MRLVFVDDSANPSPPRPHLGPLVALGAVIVPEPSVPGYIAQITTIRNELGIPPDEEIKWKPKKGSFLAAAGGDLVRTLRTRMLQAATDCNIRSVVVIVDHSRAYTSYSPAEVGRQILDWLYDRVSMHLADHDDIGIVIADKPGGGHREDTKFLADTLALTSYGTKYVKPNRIVLPIVTAPSHHLPHLQLADLVVAATTAAVAGLPHGLELIDMLKPLAHTRRWPVPLIGGAGLVLFPPEIYDLHHWVFGEDYYVKGNTGHPIGPSSVRDVAGQPIPQPRRPYQVASCLIDSSTPD